MPLYRCTKCQKRRALPKTIDQYIYKPKCKACKSLLTYRDTWQERKNADKLNICKCDALSYPHRAGSDIFCIQSTKQPTNEDYAHYYGVQS